mgnify:CR=1 FL=1
MRTEEEVDAIIKKHSLISAVDLVKMKCKFCGSFWAVHPYRVRPSRDFPNGPVCDCNARGVLVVVEG